MAAILFIEEQKCVRRLFRAVFEQWGYTVAEASRRDEAFSICQRQPVDAVIVDLPLPDGDGLATIDQMRHEYPTIKIVAISGEDYANNILGFARVCGANRAFVKPVPVDEVLAAVQDLSRPADQHPIHSQAA